MVGMGQKDSYVGGGACIGFSVGGAKDVNNFREAILSGQTPKMSSISCSGLFYDYYFDTQLEAEGKSQETAEAASDMLDDDEKTDSNKDTKDKDTNKDGHLEF